MKTYYELLEVAATVSPDEIKRAFRAQIARYHPDKVHHLGKEFQEIAATRAAELTEAYRILSHEGRRAEYDAQLKASPAAAGQTTVPAAPGEQPPASAQETPRATGTAAAPTAESAAPRTEGGGEMSGQFVKDRASRDTFVRKAIIERFRQACLQVDVGYDEASVRGFDISCAPKAKMFGRGKGPRLLGLFVSRVDTASVAQAWALAGKLDLPKGEDVCIILMGTQLAPARELADAIAEQRRRPAARGGKVTLIPVNASVWDAHIPTDAPNVAKNLLARLRSGM